MSRVCICQLMHLHLQAAEDDAELIASPLLYLHGLLPQPWHQHQVSDGDRGEIEHGPARPAAGLAGRRARSFACGLFGEPREPLRRLLRLPELLPCSTATRLLGLLHEVGDLLLRRCQLGSELLLLLPPHPLLLHCQILQVRNQPAISPQSACNQPAISSQSARNQLAISPQHVFKGKA
jgi:hypothetical protein